jgi:sulfite exporter TauE/SafE
MPQELGIVAMFLVGLLGAGHCAAMCGGIVGALSTAPNGSKALFHVAYSIGRVTSYAVAGAIAGSVGGIGLLISDVLPMQMVLYVLANAMLVVLGLYLAGLSSFAARFEALGSALWRRLQPLAGRLLPVRSVGSALVVGALWGWIPCGLVYAVLATALLSGNAFDGAYLMMAFGAGTIPNLILAGLFMSRVTSVFRSKLFRGICGALVFGFGVSGLVHAFEIRDHIGHSILCIGHL